MSASRGLSSIFDFPQKSRLTRPRPSTNFKSGFWLLGYSSVSGTADWGGREERLTGARSHFSALT